MNDHCKTSFLMLLQRFFVEHLSQHRAVSPQTIAAYHDTFRLFLNFAELKIGKAPSAILLTDLKASLLLDFLEYLEKERGNSVRSRNARLAAIRTFLKYASHYDHDALGTIEKTLAIPMKRFERQMVGFITREEIQAIIDAPDIKTWSGARDRALFSVMYNTGARVSELLGLRCTDVVLENQPAVHLKGKGRKERTVPIWKQNATIIRNWRKQLGSDTDECFLFPNRKGDKMTRSNVTQRLKLAASKATSKCPSLAGRPISPHIIRHSTAMHLLQSGVDIAIIALWLGHEDTATTHMYVEADLSMKEKALKQLQSPKLKAGRYQPPDKLISFLQTL